MNDTRSRILYLLGPLQSDDDAAYGNFWDIPLINSHLKNK